MHREQWISGVAVGWQILYAYFDAPIRYWQSKKYRIESKHLCWHLRRSKVKGKVWTIQSWRRSLLWMLTFVFGIIIRNISSAQNWLVFYCTDFKVQLNSVRPSLNVAYYFLMCISSINWKTLAKSSFRLLIDILRSWQVAGDTDTTFTVFYQAISLGP